MSGMRDSHRMFLQNFLCKGLLEAKEVKQLYKQCLERHGEAYPEDDTERRNRLSAFVRTINANIHPIHMEIKKGVNEDDWSNHYGLVNITRSDITKMASDYTPNELEFFKKIVEQVVLSEEGTISSIETLNLTEGLEKKITKNDAQELLKRMTCELWISQENGRVSLSCRAILELEQYMKEMFPDIVKMCNLCSKICLKGQTCEDCGIKVHFQCANILFKKQEVPKCPGNGCGAAWGHDIPRRGNDLDASQVAHMPQTLSQPNRKRKHHR